MDHLGEADEYLYRAEEHRNLFTDSDNLAAAGAHAVLALIDIITGDRETEIQDANQHIVELQAEIEAADQRIGELADQLDGCNNTLRKHEQAAANNTNPNELRKSYE